MLDGKISIFDNTFKNNRFNILSILMFGRNV